VRNGKAQVRAAHGTGANNIKLTRAQTTGFDEMRVGTADGITLDAFGWDAFPAATPDGVVPAQHHRADGCKASNEQAE
jgi:hypothetical protein